MPFAKDQGIGCWHQVSKDLLRRYGTWLEANDYHDKTQYIELTVLKQVVKWMVAEKLLPATSLLSLKSKKSAGTNTYCYSHAEVQAIVQYCGEEPSLHWLADVVFCSMSADHDVPEQLLMSWLGHRDSEMIRRYYHLRQEETRRQMAKIPFLGKPGNESVRGGVEKQRSQE